MKKEIKTEHLIEAPAEKVWSHIRTGENVHIWLPIITSCRVEGEKRFCTTEHGLLNETIVRSDDNERVFQYAIPEQELFPVTGIFGTMQVTQVSDTSSRLTWDVEFDIEDESLFPEIKAQIEQLYSMGANGLGQLANSSLQVVQAA